MEESPRPNREQQAELFRAIGERLHAARKSWGLDLEGVANGTGLSAARIAQIESGRGSWFFAEMVELARLYWVSLDYVAGLTTDPSVREGRIVDHRAFGLLLGPVRAAARAGARKMVTNELVVREAEEKTAEKLEEAVLTCKPLQDPRAWAFHIGKHEAQRLAEQRKRVSLNGQTEAVSAPAAEETGESALLLVDRAGLRQAVADRRHLLRKAPWAVIQAILEHRSLKAAARALGKDVSNVRRIFNRALEKLRGGGVGLCESVDVGLGTAASFSPVSLPRRNKRNGNRLVPSGDQPFVLSRRNRQPGKSPSPLL